VSRRDRIKDLYALPAAPPPKELAAANSTTASTTADSPAVKDARVSAGPVRAMGLALDRMEQESRDLQATLAAGAAVIELDPTVVEGSFVRDRLIDFEDGSLAALKASIAERGQEVPILVRPHSELEGTYQVAYGHRRLHAVRQLGLKVKAVVRDMTDTELVVSQGVENSARHDLSYIERALFASRLEDRGFERSVIMDALSTDKGELSKLIAVAKAIPERVITAIGPAPKTGRRRWLALAELCDDERLVRAVEKVLKQPDVRGAESDARFQRAMAAASQPRPKPAVESWSTPAGLRAARIKKDEKAFTLVIDQTVAPNFGNFLAARLDELFQEFQSQSQ